MNDGGSAFPRPAFAPQGVTCEDCEINDSREGMSIRDYFAAAAMTGLLAGCIVDPDDKDHCVAERSYGMADAMLRVRDSKPNVDAGLPPEFRQVIEECSDETEPETR